MQVTVLIGFCYICSSAVHSKLTTSLLFSVVHHAISLSSHPSRSICGISPSASTTTFDFSIKMNSLTLLLLLSVAPCAIAYMNPYGVIGWRVNQPVAGQSANVPVNAPPTQVLAPPLFATRRWTATTTTTTTTTTPATRSNGTPTLEEKSKAKECYFNRTWTGIGSINEHLGDPSFQDAIFCFQVVYNVPSDLNNPLDIAFYTELNKVYNQMEIEALEDKRILQNCYWLFNGKFAPCGGFINAEEFRSTSRGQYRNQVWINLKMAGYYCYEGNDTPLCVEYRKTVVYDEVYKQANDHDDFEVDTEDNQMTSTTQDSTEDYTQSTTTTAYDYDLDQGGNNDIEVLKMNTEDYTQASTTTAFSIDESL